MEERWMDDLILEAKDATDWSYKGEGAANLVLSYNGTSPSLVCKVIRVHKIPNNGSQAETGHGVWSKHERLLWKDAGSMETAPTKETADRLYLQCVMIPLLGPGYVDAGRRVLVSREFLESVERNVLLLRPGWRVNASKLSQLSEYDPLDLFTGSRDGIHKAVSALFATPQNNLRVFLNGSLVYGSLGGGMNGTTFLNGETFEDNIRSFVKADNDLCMSNFVHLVAETIFKLGVMDKLLEVQKLDNFDIEGAIHAYYDVISQPCMVCRNLEEEEVCRYTSLHSIPMEGSMKIVKDYLISATAKDCSLMICFRMKKDDDSQYCYDNINLESTGQTFDYKACFIDLDLKPLDKMKYYYELDQKIVNNYNKTGETENGTIHPVECQH